MPVLGMFASGLLNRRAERIVEERQSNLLGVEVYRPSVAVKTPVPVCGAKDCTGGWTPAWKKRRRPVFESQWGCSGNCVRALVRAAVRRESGDGGREDEGHGSHRHRVPLGLVLLAQGWITHPQLRTALAAQRSSGHGRIGEWLEESCGLPKERVMRGLGVQWGCPVLSTEDFHPSAMALVMPKRFVAEFGLVPVRVAGSSLIYLASKAGPDAAVSLALEQMTGLKVESGLLRESHFEAMSKSLLEEPGIATKMDAVKDADMLTDSIAKALEQQQPLASRLVRVRGYYWLRLWLESESFSGAGMLPVSTADVRDCVFEVGGRKTRGV